MNKTAKRWFTKLYDVREFTHPTFFGPVGKKIQLTDKQTGDWVGHIVFGKHNDAAYIDNAGTNLQGTGIGKYLYNRVAHELKQQGVKRLTSDPNGTTSQQAERVWLGLGKKYLLEQHNAPNTAKYTVHLDKTAGKLKDDYNYAKYVVKHKAHVISPMLQMELPLTQALAHDLSKFTPSEFIPYKNWFNSPKGLHGTGDDETHRKWREAVNLHYARNMHHWKKRGISIEQVPLKYRLENLADWYSVSKTNRSKGTTFPTFKQWYAEREDRLPIDPVTRHEADLRLGIIKQSAFSRPLITSLENGRSAGFFVSPQKVRHVINIVEDPSAWSYLSKANRHYADSYRQIYTAATATKSGLEKSLKEGLLNIAPSKKDRPFVLRHELAHFLNSKNKKWYASSEFAANNAALKRVKGKKTFAVLRVPLTATLASAQRFSEHPVAYTTAMGAVGIGTALKINKKKSVS